MSADTRADPSSERCEVPPSECCPNGVIFFLDLPRDDAKRMLEFHHALIARLRSELAEAEALLRMVRDEPSLKRVKDVMGHDLVQGVILVFLKKTGAESGPGYWDLARSKGDSVS